MANPPKTLILIFTLAVIAGLILYLESRKPKQLSGTGQSQINLPNSVRRQKKSAQYEPVKELTGTQEFLNSAPFRLADFIGQKVILVDFWTYSCINCQRTTPYLNAWWEKYRDHGLLIVGVHTPEFEFEKDIANVRRAVGQFDIKYPVVQDNDYATWRAYHNRYWPRKYLIDIDGFIVYDHIGEGAYAETEKKIQELLEERLSMLGTGGQVEKGIASPERVETVDETRSRSPEVYFGAARNQSLANGSPGKRGQQSLKFSNDPVRDRLYLSGLWSFTDEYAENKSAGAKIIFRYRGKKVFIVARSDSGVAIRVLRDGKPLLEHAGADISRDDQSSGIITEDRLYRLIEDQAYGEHLLEIIIDAPGLQVFTFTFG